MHPAHAGLGRLKTTFFFRHLVVAWYSPTGWFSQSLHCCCPGSSGIICSSTYSWILRDACWWCHEARQQWVNHLGQKLGSDLITLCPTVALSAYFVQSALPHLFVLAASSVYLVAGAACRPESLAHQTQQHTLLPILYEHSNRPVLSA